MLLQAEVKIEPSDWPSRVQEGESKGGPDTLRDPMRLSWASPEAFVNLVKLDVQVCKDLTMESFYLISFLAEF